MPVAMRRDAGEPRLRGPWPRSPRGGGQLCDQMGRQQFHPALRAAAGLFAGNLRMHRADIACRRAPQWPAVSSRSPGTAQVRVAGHLGMHRADVDHRGTGFDVGVVHVHLGDERDASCPGRRRASGVIRSRSATMSALVRNVSNASVRSACDLLCGDGDLGQRVDPVGGVVFQPQRPGFGELHVDDDPLGRGQAPPTRRTVRVRSGRCRRRRVSSGPRGWRR